MTRACALKAGEWLESAGVLGKRVNDLRLDELESVATAIISEFILQLHQEGRNAEAEAVPVLHFGA